MKEKLSGATEWELVTWGRDSTDVIGQSDELCKMNIPMKYKEAMRAFGIPIV